MSEEYQDIENHEEAGNYISDALIPKNIVTKVKNNGILNLSESDGVSRSILERFNRENIIYYGIMQGEQNVKIEQANKSFQAPIVRQEQVAKRLQKIKESHRKKIGHLHINVIQIIIKSSFREGIKTPVELRVEDNRIQQKQYSCLGKIEGDLGYGVIKFNVSLQYPIPLETKSFNNCIGVICDFKNKELMKNGDIPLIVTYRVSYALSNSSLSIKYQHLDRLYTEKLFNETSTMIKEDQLQKQFIKGHSQRFNNLRLGSGSSSSNQIISTENNQEIEQPLRRNNLYRENQLERLNSQVTELSGVVRNLNNRI